VVQVLLMLAAVEALVLHPEAAVLAAVVLD
jgi:hypothetical protein